LVANLIALVVVVLVALLMASAPGGSAGVARVAGILILFTLALTWIAVIAVSPRSPRRRGRVRLPDLFLPSSARHSCHRTMPGPVRAFADNQPVTSIVNTIRDLYTQRRWVRHLDASLVCRHPHPRVHLRHGRVPPPDR